MCQSTEGKAATSCKSSYNILLSIRTGKAGGLFFFLNHHALLIRKELESPFLLKKGWKQKHKSANIKKQCQMVIYFYFFIVVLFMFRFVRGNPVTSSGTKT